MEHQLTKEELRNTKINRKEFKNIKRNNIYIVLDNFKVHYNIGIVFRLADAILAKKVYLCGTTCTPPNVKIKKTSIGAEKWVPYEYVENTLDIVKKLKEEGVEIVALEITDKSIDYTKYIPNREKGVCLVLGREYDGVSKEIIDIADYSIHLPIYGMCNSINVSTAASVAMYDILEKLKKNSSEKILKNKRKRRLSMDIKTRKMIENTQKDLDMANKVIKETEELIQRVDKLLEKVDRQNEKI